TFTSSSNTTKFDVSKSNVDKRSTSSTLYVNATLNNDGGLEALAYFSDTVKEDAVTITASLLDNQPTQPQDAQFSFKEIAYNLTLKKISDGAAADGIAQDSASVIIKDKNNNTPTSGTFIITFTSSSNTTKFDVSKSNVDKRSTSSTLYVNATLNDDGELEALAYFSDTVEEDAVTITASLLDNQSTKTQDAQFSFKSDKWLLTAKDAYSYAQADGIQTNIIGVNISLNGKSVPEGLNPIIQLELDNSDVSFDLKAALPGSTSSKYLIKARPNDTGDFNDCLVGFKADKPCSVNVSVSVPSVKEIKPQSIPFSFRPNYILKLEKQIDNQKNDGSDNSLVAKVTTNDPNGPNKSFLIRFYTENSDFVLFDMAGVDIDKSRSRPTDIYVKTRFINDKDPYQWVQAGFYSYSPGTVTIRAQIFGYYNSDAQKSEDFTFIDYDPNQFVFDNNIFRSTENVTAYYKCLDTKGKPIIGKNIIFAISDANFYINNTDKPVEKQTDSNGIAQVQIGGLYTGVNEVTNLEIYVDNLPEYKKLFYYNSSPFKISIGEPEKVGSEILCNLTRFPPGDDPIQVQLSIVDESLTPDEDVYFVLNNSNKMTATVLSTPYNVSLASRKSKTSRLYVSFKNGDDEQYRSVPIVFE
ncbi:hypothetical protein, partial [Ochrobactrum sp. MYb379]|uniref:hypothetical protein n=1 Tax=Ochrobactrum sp. MYb379 TaxID=2745275 RepID=UPI00309C8E68